MISLYHFLYSLKGIFCFTVFFGDALWPSVLRILLKVDYGTKVSAPRERERERERMSHTEGEGRSGRNMKGSRQPAAGQVWGRTCSVVGVSTSSTVRKVYLSLAVKTDFTAAVHVCVCV